MIDFTPIAKPYFDVRLRQALRYIEHAESVQREQLDGLLQRASRTEIGVRYGFGDRMMSYEQFRERVPLHTYQDLKDDIMRMIRGEKNVLWRGVTRQFAQSSGTSDGRSKYIPITDESLSECHYRGGRDVVAHYLNMNPSSRLFSGKGFILGGSFANDLTLPKRVKVGDLSANLINNIPTLVNRVRIPDKRTALIPDWAEKLPALVEASRNRNVTNISGVPSWFLPVLKEIIRRQGVETIHQVWPNLEVFFHGGVSFDPYRAEYASICDMTKMHFVDTYNASEGFFATQSSLDSTAMLLLLDLSVFYEFIPLKESGREQPKAIPIWEVEKGQTYELIISACNGLWRYRLGDTVRIENISPLKIRVAGRTKHYINAFGEELMVHNAEEAIKLTTNDTGAMVLNYTAAPVYAQGGECGHHQWLIEFSRPPADIDEFAEQLDQHLQQLNSDYAAKRAHNIVLSRLSITEARPGLFDRWMRKRGRPGAQHKVPRLSNDRSIIEQLLQINDTIGNI